MIVRSWMTKLAPAGGTVTFGATHYEKPLEASLNYIDSCYTDYRTYGPLNQQDIEGIDVLEGGPGDSFGIGLRFLADGARRYVGVDAFRSVEDPEQQRRIYAGLRARLNAAGQRRFDECLDLSAGVRADENRLKMIYGSGVGDFARLFPRASFDLILSRAVLEQVHDTEAAFRSMDAVLKPGGLMLHKIDLSDYGLFSGRGHHPLTMLTFPGWIYGLLAPNSGNLNRFVLPDYRRLLAAMGYQARLFIASVIRQGYPQRELPQPYRESPRRGTDYTETEVQMVEQARPRLTEPYRAMAAEDLMVAGVFLSARKPG